MKSQGENIAPYSIGKIMLPVLIGVAVMWRVYSDQLSDFDWSSVEFTATTWLGIILAFLCMCGREIGFVCRYRFITCGDLTWGQAFKVTMMCEFSSAVTPSSVGGSSLSMLFMNRYGISIGRGTTLMLSTIFFDGLFCVLSIPLVLMFVSWDSLVAPLKLQLDLDMSGLLWAIYVGIAVWTALLFAGIVLWPQWIKKLLEAVFSVKLLSKWKSWAISTGENMVNASQELKGHPMSWWLKNMAVTTFSWVCRYLMVCALIFAFVDGADQWLVFARQAVVWLVLIVCPTPGGSGLGEWLFNDFYGDIIAAASMSLVVVVALLWRILSYYIYLIIGAIVAPLWMKGKKK